MSDMFEKDFVQFMDENMNSAAHIEFKKEAGSEGKTAVRIEGHGGLLFYGMCTLLKELARSEAKTAGEDEMAKGYVNLVCKTVIEEMGMDTAREPERNEIRVTDLKPGQTIRFEFGAPDNWVRLTIRTIQHFENQVILTGCNTGFQYDYSFRPNEMVEVVGCE